VREGARGIPRSRGGSETDTQSERGRHRHTGAERKREKEDAVDEHTTRERGNVLHLQFGIVNVPTRSHVALGVGEEIMRAEHSEVVLAYLRRAGSGDNAS
jgi:hypothetical protein